MTACVDSAVVHGLMADQYYHRSLFSEDEDLGFNLTSMSGGSSMSYQPTTMGSNYGWNSLTTNSYYQAPTSSSYSPHVFGSSTTSTTASPASRLSSHAGADVARIEVALNQYHAALSQAVSGTSEHTKLTQDYFHLYNYYLQLVAQPGESEAGDGDDESEHDDEADGQTPGSASTEGPPCTPVVTLGSDGKKHRHFPCPYPRCAARPKRKADLDRHVQCVHGRKAGSGENLHPCPEPGCTRIGARGFTRRDHLVEHLRNYHQQESKYPKKTSSKGKAAAAAAAAAGIAGMGEESGPTKRGRR